MWSQIQYQNTKLSFFMSYTWASSSQNSLRFWVIPSYTPTSLKCAWPLIVFKQSQKHFFLIIPMHTLCFISFYLFCFVAFDDEHCWEPYMPHGNFSSSDITYQLGTTVTFACSSGFVMEQGSGTIECVDPSNPHWNDTEPVCRGNIQS